MFIYLVFVILMIGRANWGAISNIFIHIQVHILLWGFIDSKTKKALANFSFSNYDKQTIPIWIGKWKMRLLHLVFP